MTGHNPEVDIAHRRSNAENMNAIRGSIGEIKESVGDIVQTEREHMHEVYEKAKQHAKVVMSGFENYVREQPVRSLLIAAGTGALLGYVLGRRR